MGRWRVPERDFLRPKSSFMCFSRASMKRQRNYDAPPGLPCSNRYHTVAWQGIYWNASYRGGCLEWPVHAGSSAIDDIWDGSLSCIKLLRCDRSGSNERLTGLQSTLVLGHETVGNGSRFLSSKFLCYPFFCVPCGPVVVGVVLIAIWRTQREHNDLNRTLVLMVLWQWVPDYILVMISYNRNNLSVQVALVPRGVIEWWRRINCRAGGKLGI